MAAELEELELFDALELSDELPPETLPRRRDPALWFVLPVALFTLCLALLFLARTPLLAGPTLQRIMEREAAQRGVDLYIESMRPVGLFGVRFEHVRGRLQRGPYIMDTRMQAMEVSPDLWASLVQGRPVPGEIKIEGAHVIMERLSSNTTPSKKDPAPPPGSSQALGLETLTIVGVNVDVELRAGEAFASTRPIRLARVEATLPLQGTPLPTELHAHGTLPDGVLFSLSTRSRKGSPGSEIVLAPSQPTRIHEWFGDQLPFEMTAQGVVLCSGCEQDSIEFGRVDLKLPTLGKGLDVTAPSAQLVWEQGVAELKLDGVGVQGLRDPKLGVDLTRSRFVVDIASGKHSGELELQERHRQGLLQIQWSWEHRIRTLQGSVQARKFALKPLLRLLDADPVLHAGEITGTLSATVDLNTRTGELSTDLELVNAQATLPMLTSDSLSIPSLGIRSDLLLDLDARALSLSNLEVDLHGVRPLKMRASVIKAQQGWRFEVSALGRDIDAEALRAALPPMIRAPVEGATLRGHFGYDFHASGHSAYPESLRLDINIDGDVEVLKDGPMADIRALAVAGAPWSGPESGLKIPIPAADWVAYEELPAHVPRGLIAAEDAQFFRHNGFDFGGLARAMMHNLSVGRMERGGSTVTQQIIKNLFLSRERTAARKLQEAYLTWRVEKELSKTRLLEIYFNIVQWGDELHGIRAAADHYFERTPAELSVEQISLLATILPNPVRYGAHIDQGRYASSRLTKFEHIMSNLRFMGDITSQDYAHLMAQARRGKIGGLSLTICADDDTAPAQAPPCKRKDAEL